MRLGRAQELGQEMLAALAPACERIMIAGSVRRQCEQVNDLDIVLMPKGRAALHAALWESPAKLDRFAPAENWIANIDGFQVDLWLAHPREGDLFSPIKSNWGAILLCRTGSVQHNTQFCALAMNKGLKFSPYKGLIDTKTAVVIASETEEEIYEALGLKWRPPEERQCL